jgi:hypothetical protein
VVVAADRWLDFKNTASVGGRRWINGIARNSVEIPKGVTPPWQQCRVIGRDTLEVMMELCCE